MSLLRIGACIAFACIVSIAAVRPANADTPSCFVRPPTFAVASDTIPSAPEPIACVFAAKLIAASDETQLAWIPGAAVNAILNAPGAFPIDAYAIRFVVTPQFNTAFAGRDTLVRFGNDDFTARVGSWWTVQETIVDDAGRPLQKAAVASLLALPPSSNASFEAISSGVRAGTVGYFGVVAPAFGQTGGGVQFWFPGEPVFTAPSRPLP